VYIVIPVEIEQALAALGLPPSATDADIKSAYRALSKAHHPDVGGSSTQRQADLNTAYATVERWIRQGRPASMTDGVEEIRCNTRVYTPQETADLLTAALRTAFPGVSFRVAVSRPRSLAVVGGALLNVRWTRGPTEPEVKAITNDYEGIEICRGVRDRVVPDGPGRWKQYDVLAIRRRRRESTTTRRYSDSMLRLLAQPASRGRPSGGPRA
jgi:hypothetical protein